jgi:hypothetical protein
MQKYTSQPLKSLSIYLERGRRILDLFIEGEEAAAIDWVSLHRAAFHNFLAVESKYGVEAGRRSELEALCKEIEFVNQQIMQHVNRAVQEAQAKLFSLQREKNRLRKFRSFPPENTTFQRSI